MAFQEHVRYTYRRANRCFRWCISFIPLFWKYEVLESSIKLTFLRGAMKSSQYKCLAEGSERQAIILALIIPRT